MNDTQSKSVVIVAGGSGKRMGSSIPKQFLDLDGLPVLIHTINAFYRFDETIEVIVVLPEYELDQWQAICTKYNYDFPIITTTGGETRFHSVKKGLEKATGKLVAIHDGVRPFASKDVIERAFRSAENQTNGIVAVPLKDSLRKGSTSENKAEDRSAFHLVQTPQVFQTDLLVQAFDQPYSPSFTDDASVFEAAGHNIHLVEGDYKNIKLTTPEDMLIAEGFMKHLY